MCVCLFVCLSRAAISALNCRRPFGLLCLPPGRPTRTPNKQEPASFSHLDPELSPNAIAANLHPQPEHTGGEIPIHLTCWIHYFLRMLDNKQMCNVLLRGGRRSDVIRRALSDDNNSKRVGNDQIVLSCRSASIFSFLCRAQASVGATTAASRARDDQENVFPSPLRKLMFGYSRCVTQRS